MREFWVSVWPTAQQPAPRQRLGRYVPGTTDHPAKMLPAIAAQAIDAYTQPGDLVLDPMCGIGTTIVEAVHADRHALGVEYEARWAAIARANLALARGAHVPGRGRVLTGDARNLTDLIHQHAPGLAGRCRLVVTSPPYGASVHGKVRADQAGITKWAHHYTPTGKTPSHARVHQHRSGNLAAEPPDGLRDGLATILASCRQLLQPGGIVAITARPWRHHGELVDLPAVITAAAEQAGLIPHERLVALLAGIRGEQLVPRTSFFQILQIRSAQQRGIPLQAIAHEDLLVYRAPEKCRSSGPRRAARP